MIRLLVGYVLIVSLFTLLILPLTGCATWGQTGIGGCKTLCQGEKAERFKDETMECVCRNHEEVSK